MLGLLLEPEGRPGRTLLPEDTTVRRSGSEALVAFAGTVGAIFGACLGSLVTQFLYPRFAADQINEWYGIQMAYTIPPNAVVGGLTGCALALWYHQPRDAIWVCLFGGGVVAVACVLVLLVGPPGYVGMEYNGPCIMGPPLLGAVLLFLWGLAMAARDGGDRARADLRRDGGDGLNR